MKKPIDRNKEARENLEKALEQFTIVPLDNGTFEIFNFGEETTVTCNSETEVLKVVELAYCIMNNISFNVIAYCIMNNISFNVKNLELQSKAEKLIGNNQERTAN